MLDRQIQGRQLSKEDAEFEKKWQVSFREYSDFATQFTIWKKFLKTAPEILDHESYEELPAKLEEEDFQLPTLTSSIHDDEKYSQDADSRQEYEAHVLEEERRPHQRTLSLDELKQQLDIWSPRNLTIFCVEYLIDSEIFSLKALDEGHSTNFEALETRINKIEKMYGHLLKTLNIADYYLTQPATFDPIYTTHPKKYDIEKECAHLKKILDNLSMLSSTRQLELLKMKIRIESYGIVLPHSDEMLTLAGLNNKQCQQEMDAILAANKLAAEQAETAALDAPTDEPEPNNGSLRKSKRVTSHLHTLGETCDSDHDDEDYKDDKDDERERLLSATATPAASTTAAQQPAASSLAKNILFGIVVGLAAAILIAGVVAAVLFATAATFGGATLGLIFGGIFGAGIIGGFFGGAMKSCCQPDALHEPSAAPFSPVKTNNASMHNDLGIKTVNALTPSSGAPRHLLPQGEKGGMSKDIFILPAPSASLTSQNPEKTTASTPSVTRR